MYITHKYYVYGIYVLKFIDVSSSMNGFTVLIQEMFFLVILKGAEKDDT